MTEAHRRAGRPTDKIDAREKLIFHARELFTIMAYDKVSTRLVAQKAGVNVAMIRYYFGNKEGLFETMLRETLSPMQKQMQALVADSNERNFFDLMRTYYREMIKVPQFPRLIAQVMHMPPPRLNANYSRKSSLISASQCKAFSLISWSKAAFYEKTQTLNFVASLISA